MIQIPWLEPAELAFPPVEQALQDPDGLLAAGGDLSADRLLLAYRSGIFPWYEAGQPVLWWSPDPRTVVIPKDIHVSRSMRKTLQQSSFTVTCDQAFSEVITACASPRRDTDATWITREMQSAYTHLHKMGYAHSVEVWQDKQLIGGLYGIALGRVFFGESMFSRASNASKVGFITLAHNLNRWGFTLIDCQVASEHLFSLGATEITRHAFTTHLQQAIGRPGPSPFWTAGTAGTAALTYC